MARLAVDRWDDYYAEGKSFAPVTEPEKAAMARLLGPADGRSVLDVGCGTGELTRWLHDAGFVPLGVDVSEVALRIAADRSGPAGPVCLRWDAEFDDLEALPTAAFSVICCRLVWPFLEPVARSRLRSLLAPGGCLLLLTPVRERLTERRMTGMTGAQILELESEFGDTERVDLGRLTLLSLRSPIDFHPSDAAF